MEKIELEIIDYGYNGEGVAKQNSQVFFVPKTILGEKIECEIVKKNSKFSQGRLLNIIEKSDKRIISKCPYFAQCGGCNFQHVSYDDELDIKKKLFLKELSKVVRLDDVEFVKSDSEFGYRNKVRFKIKDKSLGFYEEKSNNFVKISNCLIVSDKLNQMIAKINEFLVCSVVIFDEVILHDFSENVLIDFLTKDKVSIDYVQKNFNCPVMINHKGNELICQENGVTYSFKGDAFRQVNNFIREKLYNEVADNVDGQTIINAFSGSGVLSAILAQKAKRVYGIELNKFAHEGAEKLKELNHISNLFNINGYAEKELFKINDSVDCIVLDPPRAGCNENGLRAILDKKVKRVIYVSCAPSTLVRDLNILKEKYKISSVKLFDMFPRTANMESLTILDLI